MQPVDLALLATHQRYERTFAAADEGDERREVEALADLDPVGHGIGQREREPEVVRAGAEDGDAVRPVPVELDRQVLLQPLDVRLQPLAGGVARAARGVLMRLVDQRAHARLGVARGRRVAGVEIEVEADRAAVLGLEIGQLTQAVPVHGCRPYPLPPFRTARF